MHRTPTARAAWLTFLGLTVMAAASCASGSDPGHGGGTGGSAPSNTGGAGSGGAAPGSGGRSAGTGGAVTATGGAPAGTGGAPAGTGGGQPGTGGASNPDAAAPTDGGTSGGDASFGVCDPFTNAGCAEGKKCSALQSGTTLSLGCGTKGTKTTGAVCTPVLNGQTQTGDDCADGLACFSAQGENGATCHQICAGGGAGSPACPSPQTCSLRINGLDAISFCQTTTSCSPLTQSPCTATQGCYLTPSGPMCAIAGTKKPGDACSGANDCARGSTCLLTNNVGKCSYFCSVGGAAPMCAASGTGGATCGAVSGAPPGEPNLGTCK